MPGKPKEFTFGVNDASIMMSHLPLQDAETAKAISETDQWREDQVMTAEVKINGVEIPSHIFEELLKHWYTSIERQIAQEKGVLALRETVKRQAEEMVQNKMADLVNKLSDLNYHIDHLLED